MSTLKTGYRRGAPELDPNCTRTGLSGTTEFLVKYPRGPTDMHTRRHAHTHTEARAHTHTHTFVCLRFVGLAAVSIQLRLRVGMPDTSYNL